MYLYVNTYKFFTRTISVIRLYYIVSTSIMIHYNIFMKTNSIFLFLFLFSSMRYSGKYLKSRGSVSSDIIIHSTTIVRFVIYVRLLILQTVLDRLKVFIKKKKKTYWKKRNNNIFEFCIKDYIFQ